MSKKEQSALPAVLGQNDVPKLLEQVNAQIKLIKGNLPEVPKTTGNLDGFGTIANIKDLQTLIKAASAVMGKKKAYIEAAKEVVPQGRKVPPFQLNGSSAEDWMIDIKARAIVVAHEAELKKLTDMKKILEENLSAEAKLANDLAKIKNMLTDE